MTALCTTLLMLFSDRAWLPATEVLVGEWRRVNRPSPVCVSLGLWWSVREAPLPSLCSEAGVECRLLAERRQSFLERIGERLPTILSELRHGRALDILVLDSDVVLQRNAGVWIPHLRPGRPLVFQQEWPCQTAPHQLCVNGGVWWAQRSNATVALLEEAVGLMRRLRVPDQDALQIVAARHAHKIGFLPLDRYPNGYAFLQPHLSLVRRAGSLHLIHANWLRTLGCKADVMARARRRQNVLLAGNCSLF